MKWAKNSPLQFDNLNEKERRRTKRWSEVKSKEEGTHTHTHTHTKRMANKFSESLKKESTKKGAKLLLYL